MKPSNANFDEHTLISSPLMQFETTECESDLLQVNGASVYSEMNWGLDMEQK